MAATCDDCGQPAELIIVELTDKEADALCWSDLLKRCLQLAADATMPDGDAAQNGAQEPVAGNPAAVQTAAGAP